MSALSLTPKVLSLVCATLMAFVAVSQRGFAEDARDVQEDKYYKAQALDWSKANSGIAIAIGYPTETDLDIDFLSEQITIGFGQIAGGPVTLKFFSEESSRFRGQVITFFVRGAPIGPFGLTEAAQSMPSVFELHKVAEGA